MPTPKTLAAQVEAAIERLLDDPAATPTDAELLAAAVADIPEHGLSMAEMVEMAGVSQHALRYYESQGLLSADRNTGGQRVYGAAAVQRVLLITRMRVSGMPMATLRELTRLLDAHGAAHPEVRALLSEHRGHLRRQIAELRLALAITEYKLASGRLGPED